MTASVQPESQASQWRLIWWRFRHHKLAMIGAWVLGLLIFLAVFADVIAPVAPNSRDTAYVLGPPMVIKMRDHNGWSTPFVHGLENERDPLTLRMKTTPNPDVRRHLVVLPKVERYTLWSAIPLERRLIGLSTGEPLHLLGTDNLGRDVFARSIHALKISLSVGVLGVLIAFVLGLIIGGIAGYLGGIADFLIMRVIELIMSIPTLPLWMTLAAIVPKEWTAVQAYFAITVLLGLLGWTGLARDVRSKIISLRAEDYITAARLSGVSDWRIILRHLLPATTSYVIVALTLAFPGIILGETALSFLGFGLRPPVISLGVLLDGAQNVRTIAQSPWVMSPVAFVILIVLAFSFLGDGLRDAADPYSDKA